MAFDDLKKRVLEEIDRNADHLIENVGDPVYRDPELGFKEFRMGTVVVGKPACRGFTNKGAIVITGQPAGVAT